MLVLVDGYNVTMRDDELRSRSKEAQRDTLVERLSRSASGIAGRGGRLVVVFDAHASLGATSETRGPLTTVFAHDADDEIVRRCATARGAIAVYTDDIRLRMRISQDVGRHVEYRDVASLFAPVRSQRAGAPIASGDETLPERARKDITAELEDIWLSEDEG